MRKQVENVYVIQLGALDMMLVFGVQGFEDGTKFDWDSGFLSVWVLVQNWTWKDVT